MVLLHGKYCIMQRDSFWFYNNVWKHWLFRGIKVLMLYYDVVWCDTIMSHFGPNY